jgi:hypothetical protein
MKEVNVNRPADTFHAHNKTNSKPDRETDIVIHHSGNYYFKRWFHFRGFRICIPFVFAHLFERDPGILLCTMEFREIISEASINDPVVWRQKLKQFCARNADVFNIRERLGDGKRQFLEKIAVEIKSNSTTDRTNENYWNCKCVNCPDFI